MIKSRILDTADINENIQETVFIDRDTGKICRATEVTHAMNKDDINEFIHYLKERNIHVRYDISETE